MWVSKELLINGTELDCIDEKNFQQHPFGVWRPFGVLVSSYPPSA